MPPFPNLVSESLLVGETIKFLLASGGSASAVSVVDRVMKIRNPERGLAIELARDIVEQDPRLALESDLVELIDPFGHFIKLAETEFVVFDLETTGAKAPPCRVTEIGACRISGGKISEEFHTLIDPEIPIPPFITGLTGIDDEMVRGAPLFHDVIDDFLGFIGNSVLVAHNAHFDMGFLNYEIGRVYRERRIGNPSLCTVQLSRRLLPHIENHKLNTVARHFSVKLENHHRASDDARAAAGIFLNLLDDLHGRGIKDIAALRRFGQRKEYYVRRRKNAAGKSSESGDSSHTAR